MAKPKHLMTYQEWKYKVKTNYKIYVIKNLNKNRVLDYKMYLKLYWISLKKKEVNITKIFCMKISIYKL